MKKLKKFSIVLIVINTIILTFYILWKIANTNIWLKKSLIWLFPPEKISITYAVIALITSIVTTIIGCVNEDDDDDSILSDISYIPGATVTGLIFFSTFSFFIITIFWIGIVPRIYYYIGCFFELVYWNSIRKTFVTPPYLFVYI